MDPELRNKYQPIIGLEIHAQLLTHSKAFSSDRNAYGAAPNSNVSPISLGHPGTLPRLNQAVVDHAMRLGLAVDAEFTREMHFARKNYFYADLPKGYQITQDDTPICRKGHITITGDDGQLKKVNLVRIHMEEDSGKSIHDQDPFNTLIDLNRAGVPLLEIVSEPEIRSGEEAYRYLAEVRQLVRYLEICDGNMEEGSLRCDANVSVMLKDAKVFGTRTEVKNMNSLRNVQRAIDHEIERQIGIIESGGTVEQETRNFDAVEGITIAMRTKETTQDYRYFPEPDLQPVHITDEDLNRARNALPPLPRELMQKYTEELGLSEYDAGVLTESKPIALYFEEVTTLTRNYKRAANWVMGPVKSWLNEKGIGIDQFPLSPSTIADIITLIEDGKVSNSLAEQELFPALIEQPDQTPQAIAKTRDLIQESDEGALEQYVKEALEKYPDKVTEYQNGKKGLVGLFMGEVMKRSKGKADPKTANKLVVKMLEES